MTVNTATAGDASRGEPGASMTYGNLVQVVLKRVAPVSTAARLRTIHEDVRLKAAKFIELYTDDNVEHRSQIRNPDTG